MSHDKQQPESNERSSMLAMLGNIGWPILLGLATTSIFFVLIFRGPLNLPIMHRYFASHPVTYCETALFFIGFAALLLKCFSVLGEYACIGSVHLKPAPAPGNAIEDCGALLDDLDELPKTARTCLLAQRLRSGLEFVERSGSADKLADEIKYLADVDAVRQQDSYSLVRIVVWATPMLGFLGTVMGITEALGDLSANSKMLATSIDTAIQGLLGGLYIAFDTTALALTLSMVLMFIQFLIDRVETQVLAVVDQHATEELVGRFPTTGGETDPHVASLERMMQVVVRSTEQLVQKQAALWESTIDVAHQRWSTLFGSVGEQMQTTLATALQQSLQSHADQLVQAEKTVAEQIRAEWTKVQGGLTEHAMLMLSQQNELVKHGEMMVKVMGATGDIMKLEDALNQNLHALSGSKNFEETVLSLAATINLLNARLGKAGDNGPGLELGRSKTQGKAA